MYRHCVYCAADLGSNEAIEDFPVGRRLAFDLEKGRLWVVCRGCERWNLSPLEERWEALETLERAYRDTRTRVSTENIGLARLDEGLELVRVGRPRRPEFAAWRYGDQFGRRRKKHVIGATIATGLVAGVGLGSIALVGFSSATFLPLHVFNLVNRAVEKRRPAVRIPTADGDPVVVPRNGVGTMRIRLSDEHEDGWILDFDDPTTSGDGGFLAGSDAVRALAIMLSKVNTAGGGKRRVKEAVGFIEEAGSPDAYFRRVEHYARRQGRGHRPVAGLPVQLRLALEMAAHEDQERTALEGELKQLEAAWKEAETLAAIADDLLLPGSILGRLESIRRRVVGTA